MAATTYVYMYVTSSAKTHNVYTTTEFNFITPAYRYNQWLLIPSVSIMLHINWSASLKVILPTLQSHDWNNGTNGGCQLGTQDYSHCLCGLLIRHGPLCGHLLGSQLLQECPNWSPLPILPVPFVSYTEFKKEWQNTMKFMQPSVVQKVSYNKSQQIALHTSTILC